MTVANPDVINFCNQNIRRMADWANTLYNFSQGCQTQLIQLASAGLVSGAGNINDGSPNDGRTVMNSDHVLDFLSKINGLFSDPVFIANMEAISVNDVQPDFSSLSWNKGV